MQLGQAGASRSWKALAAAAAVVAFLAGGTAGWVAHGATTGAPSSFDTFTADALDAYRLYVVEVRHPVEVPGNERPHMTQWLTKRLGYQQHIPDLESLGLKLVGGRLLPGPTGAAAAFYMYEGASGERFTIYSAPATSPETALRYKEGDRFVGVLLGRRQARLCGERTGRPRPAQSRSPGQPRSRSIAAPRTRSPDRATPNPCADRRARSRATCA